jgi:hypothetical protein
VRLGVQRAASWVKVVSASTGFAGDQAPEVGPNVLVFRPSMSSASIQRQVNRIYAEQQHSEFGAGRYALLFLPGSYHVNLPTGSYTQAIGLGASPDDALDGLELEHGLRRRPQSVRCS